MSAPARILSLGSPAISAIAAVAGPTSRVSTACAAIWVTCAVRISDDPILKIGFGNYGHRAEATSPRTMQVASPVSAHYASSRRTIAGKS
jgi:hypothetical protein